MCRLLLANQQGIRYLEKTYSLANLLEDLELSMGGDGNGYAIRRQGKKVTSEKGTMLATDTIAKKLLTMNYEWCLFHTRLVSTASKQDKHCHPFTYKGNVLAHNGTDSSFASLGAMLGLTDSEAMLQVAVDYGLFPQVLSGFSGVFVGFTEKGLPFVTKGSYLSDLEYCHQDEAIIFASELPERIPAKKVKSPFFWYGGKPVPESSLTERTTKTYRYSYSYDDSLDPYSVSRFPSYYSSKYVAELRKRGK